MRGCEGASLIEVLVALLLIGIGLLAVAPMFVSASRGNATGGDLGTVGAAGVERMEQLRATDYDNLVVGGSLTSDTPGYFDDSRAGLIVRWTVDPNATPPDTRIVTVWASTTTHLSGPRTEVTLTTLRGRE